MVQRIGRQGNAIIVYELNRRSICASERRKIVYVSCGVECVVSRWSSSKCGRCSFDEGIRKGGYISKGR